jgi:hypothetical protein
MKQHRGKWFGQRPIAALNMWLLIGLIPAVLFSGQAIAATAGDDFDDNSQDPTKWGEDYVWGHGVLTETNQRLEYTVDTGTGDDEANRSWVLTRFPYNADWEIQIDVVNLTSLSADNQYSSFGFVVFSPRSWSDKILAELYASRWHGPPQTNGFYAYLETAWDYIGEADTWGLGVTHGALRMAFNSGTRVITVSYDPDISNGYQWVQYGSFGLAGTGGANGNTDWGLADADLFLLYVYGYSEHMIITSGQLFGDNFVESGGVVPPPPEPPEGTIGTKITINGSSFGTKKGKVLIGSVAAKVLTWADGTITCSVTKVPLPAGVYAVTINPQPYKTHPPLILTPGFVVKNPEIALVSPDHGIPGTEVSITGSFVNTKKGKVYLEYLDNGQTKKKNCKVTYWYMDPTNGASAIRFIVPKLDSGGYTLKVTNKVGAAQTTFTID